MSDPRNTQLADILLSYSIEAKPEEKIWIQVSGTLGLPLGREIYKRLVALGAYPYLDIGDDSVGKFFLDHANEKQLTKTPEIAKFIASWADKSVIIVADQNTRELAEANHNNMLLKAKAMKPIRDISLKKPWVLTYFPTYAMAQDANMGYDDFVEFYFSSVLRDWKQQHKRLQKLADLLNDAELIHIQGEDTDITLSAKGRVFVADDGKNNMPGGEVFTAPVDDSAEGHVYFNYPLLRQGKMIRDIRLWFEKGKVVKATASENQEFLRKILDTDEGSRRLGEFAIGANPGIQRYMFNVLFDEKIQGSIHMAVGEAYEECGGKNKSAIHMDIVKDMVPNGSVVSAGKKIILRNGELCV